ncbi:MAG: 23S rRNA (pseudouridine(1915)-N(3))-methyltransferase RlmH [Clostridia bacterium]|nr:23S rRNA (pseudouridine(1915)-N(3))-methyltransferase RlmH [Clostridia bacterium]
MLTVNIICVGSLKESFWREACAEYAKRLGGFCKFSIVEVSETRLSKNYSDGDIAKVMESEGARILEKIPSGSFVVAMCIEGRELSSPQLAEKLSRIALGGKSRVDFVIGGSYGLSGAVKKRADFRLSMSPMTFPHQLARVMLCEQIYRAFSINADAKYHK